MTTLGGRVKAIVDGTNLLRSVVRDFQRGTDVEFPYCTFVDPISRTRVLSGDARPVAYRRLMQLDLWEKEPSTVLPDQLATAIDGVQLPADDGDVRAYRLLVVGQQRLDDPEPAVVHTAYTLAVVELV